MEDKNENLEIIDKRIAALQKSIMQSFDLAVADARDRHNRCNEDNLERINEKRKALLNELDDRLALIKQFPSVLEADQVNLLDLETDYEIRMDFSGSLPRGRPSDIRFNKGKWKVLILAKKIP